MSQETSIWLNTQTLIGFTDKRGHAWHYKAEDQGTESNHYPHAIPVEDVERRLFDFTVSARPLFVGDVEDIGDGETFTTYRAVPDRVAWCADDNGDVFGIFSEGYAGHQYREWLLDGPATLISASRDELGIGSAGLLAARARAWVSLEVPENITTPEGVEFRPNLLACTSFDGSMATTYKRTVTNVVCDNTLAAGLSEEGQQVKVRHSRFSHLRLSDARDALAVVYETGDEFAAEVARLCAWEVSRPQWSKHLDLMVPLPAEVGRARTLATNKRDRLVDLYANDIRVAPWAGTAFGVLQAHNTYLHHYATVKGYKGATGRGLRNMENAIKGVTETADALVISTLAGVCA